MASSKEYLEYILEQLSGMDDISYRAMMGEYLVDDVENREFLCELLETMYDELPAPKKR